MAKLFWLTIVVVVPIAAFVIALIKRRGTIFLLGAVAFMLSQPLLRLPLLTWLNEQTAYKAWAMTSPLLYLGFLAFTAGLFEETARLVLLRFFVQKRTYRNGVLFGIGHGGIEAFLLVGLPVLSSGLLLVNNALFLSGTERLLAMTVHICLTLIVLTAVRRRSVGYFILAIAIHTLFNATGGYFAATQSIWVVEGLLFAATIGILCITIYIVKGNRYEKITDVVM